MPYADPEAQRAYWHARSQTREFKSAQLFIRYGITLEQYEEILTAQGGVCAICGGTKLSRGNFFHVDHDHETGEIRGLLCDRCNHGLGKFGDSVEILQKAIEYLKRF